MRITVQESSDEPLSTLMISWPFPLRLSLTPARQSFNAGRELCVTMMTETLSLVTDIRSTQFIFPRIAFRRSHQTIQTASRTIFFDIFDSPARRSTKMIEISLILKPFFQTRIDISI